jgi:RNA recognition motif-containing protein
VAAASSPGSGGAAPPEQQSRTLFVRNVSYNTSERTLMDLFKKYGEVKRVFNLIDKRGMAFITYVTPPPTHPQSSPPPNGGHVA